jgi:S-adenosyl-L-methionine hydrolase (adenosine-forming)
MAIITLMSDFGTEDHYVACMKGVILSINPKATVVDITHDIAPHGIVQAAFVLRQIWPWFPPGTVHVVVVDPGVGTSRQILVGRYTDRIVVAPDNGAISLVHRDGQFQELRIVENRAYFGGPLSCTFHGRDVMAPVGAHITSGVRLSELGPLTDHLQILGLPVPRRDAVSVTGEVLYIDHFGNLITNISVADVNSLAGRRGRLSVFLGEQPIGTIHTTYGDVEPGSVVALIDSVQRLEIAVNRGHAAEALGAKVGDMVVLR